VEPLAPHEKLFIDDEFLEEDENHGEIECVTCHDGNPDDPDWKTAHEGLIKDPTFPEAEVCLDCHEEETANYQQSLHISNGPMGLMVMNRTSEHPDVRGKVDMAMQGHCSQCHSSCGQCHVSRPTGAGGGLLSGHLFVKQPPMEEVCTACHGSRVGNEYLGKNKNSKPDVHLEKAQMKCNGCHTGDQMHGDGNEYENRYEVENGPQCVDCHNKIYGADGLNIETHKTHKGKASCQVCHAQAYTSCFNCHVATDKNDQKYFEVESHSLGFKIGLNPLRSKKYPEKFVTVRHVPVDPDTFKFYVKDGLSRFDMRPTWKMATPHNIRRQTSQNKSCDNCHGNTNLFLMETSVRPNYLKANRSVIVPPNMIPAHVQDSTLALSSPQPSMVKVKTQ